MHLIVAKEQFFYTPVLFQLKFGMFHLEYICGVGVCREQTPWVNQLLNFFRSVPTYVTVIRQR